MALGHYKTINYFDEEDSTISGPFPKEAEGQTDSYITDSYVRL
jgi:hypothetical protein